MLPGKQKVSAKLKQQNTSDSNFCCLNFHENSFCMYKNIHRLSLSCRFSFRWLPAFQSVYFSLNFFSVSFVELVKTFLFACCFDFSTVQLCVQR